MMTNGSNTDESSCASPSLRAQQDGLAAYIRDPDHVAPPPGIESRRLKIYRELFFNNVEGLLASSFPVIRKLLGDDDWNALIRDFYRDHGCRTPLFTELAREFLRYLEARDPQAPDAKARDSLPPWLRELAHYEWIELALQISEASDADIALADITPDADPAQALLNGSPALSPLAWPLAYAWPVHRISPGFLPETPPLEPTLLLVHRETGGKVAFHTLTPIAYRLLQRLDEFPQLSGRAQLQALASEAQAAESEAFIAQGLALMLEWRGKRIIPGVHGADTATPPL